MQLTSLVLPASCIFPQEDYKSDRNMLVPISREQIVLHENFKQRKIHIYFLAQYDTLGKKKKKKNTNYVAQYKQIK